MKILIVISASFFLQANGFAQTPFEKLPAATQNQFKSIASTHRSGDINQKMIEADLKKKNFDLASMPIEDAIMYIFMLISNDARKDMTDLLKDMDATRKKREALREEQQKLKESLDSLKDGGRTAFQDSLIKRKAINNTETKLTGKNYQLDVVNRESEILVNKKKLAELHSQSVDDAIKKLRQSPKLKVNRSAN